MHHESHITEPRSRFIIRKTGEVLRARALCMRKFATHVADGYMSRVAEHERIVRFYCGQGSIDSACRAEKRNAQLVQRFLAGAVKFPADLEEAWVDALPDPDRTELVRDLAARYGLAGTRLPDGKMANSITNLSDVLRDAGEIARALAPAFVDGRIDDADLPHIPRARNELRRGIADLTSLLEQIDAIASSSLRVQVAKKSSQA